MSGEKTIHNRINPKSGRIIYLLGFIILFLVSLVYLIALSFDSLWAVLLVLVSVFGIAWQYDMLKKRTKFSELNASTVGEVLSVLEDVDVEYGGLSSPTQFYINSIEVKFEVDGRVINLRASVKKSVYDQFRPGMPVTIYYDSKNPRIALLESEV
ncbi:MAG: hypothetical protein KAS36_17055 [Anaerolineales bacterium]|nr:hypothetical protein [Anaerolineales bacterium]